MKKRIVISLISIVFLALIGGGIYYFCRPVTTDAFYLNASDDVSYQRLKKLEKGLKNAGKTVILSKKDHFKSGKFNVYAAEDINNLPKVIDSKALNFLWIPAVLQGSPKPLRPFDVIVVQNIPSFGYLKAINMRTAYIPSAIDVSQNKAATQKKNLMFYGDNDSSFSLSLYLAGAHNLSVDIYGKGFENQWDRKEIIAPVAKPKDFKKYALVLADQTDENIRDEIVSQRVIDILEQGGLPYLRFNNGIAKMFDDAVPMYMNEEEFFTKMQQLLNNPQLQESHRAAILQKAQDWNTNNLAHKFIELFEVMERKMK